MEVNLTKIRNEMNDYNEKIREYEDCRENVNNILKQSSSYWNDGKSEKFFKHLSIAKIDADNVISNLKEIRDIQKYIVDEYEKFGEKIVFELKNRNKVSQKFDKLISDLNEIIIAFNNTDLTFSSNKNKIINCKSRIIAVKGNIEKLKEEISKAFDKIEEIERQINSKISKIDIEIVQETNVSDYL